MDHIEQQLMEQIQKEKNKNISFIPPVEIKEEKKDEQVPIVSTLVPKPKPINVIPDIPKVEIKKEPKIIIGEVVPDMVEAIPKVEIKKEPKIIIGEVVPDMVEAITKHIKMPIRKIDYGWKVLPPEHMDINKIPPTLDKDCWQTPLDLMKYIYDRFGKDGYMFDPCPTDPKVNGLLIDWESHNYVNPPYSKPEQPCKPGCIKKQCKERGCITEYKPGQIDWVKKGIEEAQKGKHVYMLIPSDTSTKLWNDYVMKYAYTIYFIKGRIKFVGANGMPKFGNALVYFNDMTTGIVPCEIIDYKGK